MEVEAGTSCTLPGGFISASLFQPTADTKLINFLPHVNTTRSKMIQRLLDYIKPARVDRGKSVRPSPAAVCQNLNFDAIFFRGDKQLWSGTV